MQVDPRAIIAQMQAIEAQINRLQSFIAELTQARENVSRSMESIKALSGSGGPVMVMLDPSMNSMAIVEVRDREKFIVHLGLDVYARLDKEKALEILDEKEARLSKSISEATKQLKDLTSLYEQYQAALQQISAQQAKQARKQ